MDDLEGVKLHEADLLIPDLVSQCADAVEHPELVHTAASRTSRGWRATGAGADHGFSQVWGSYLRQRAFQRRKLEARTNGTAHARSVLLQVLARRQDVSSGPELF
jgi:hypothetical protein